MDFNQTIATLNIENNQVKISALQDVPIEFSKLVTTYLLKNKIEIIYDICEIKAEDDSVTKADESTFFPEPDNNPEPDEIEESDPIAIFEKECAKEFNYKVLSAVDQHMIDITNLHDKVLSINEQMELARKYKEEGDLAARDKLIHANVLLVLSLAKRYYRDNYPYGDVVQDGYLGLLKAVEKYNYKLGFAFTTYATYWICQSMGREMNTNADTIRIPVNQKYKLTVFRRAINDLSLELGTTPTIKEIAAYLKFSEKKVTAYLTYLQTQDLASLDAVIYESEELTLEGTIASEDDIVEDPQEKMDQKALRIVLEELITGFSPREQLLLRTRFGFEDGSKHTLEEAGNTINVTRERARQIEAKLLRKLRHPSRSNQLRDFYY